MVLNDCDVYSYKADVESDPFGEHNILSSAAASIHTLELLVGLEAFGVSATCSLSGQWHCQIVCWRQIIVELQLAQEQLHAGTTANVNLLLVQERMGMSGVSTSSSTTRS